MLRERHPGLRYRRRMSRDDDRTRPAERPAPPARLDRLDAWRGAAMVWMTVFHAAFDLNQFRLIPRQNFYADPFWTLQRVAIVTMFLACAGVAQAVAGARPAAPGRFWRRWGQVAACAALVSAGSALMFPRSWISFGVLHAIAAMLLLVEAARHGAPRLAASPGAWAGMGAGAIALPAWVAHPFFDSRWTNWIGLTTRRPVTEDYVPMLPWFGVMALGMAAGLWLLAHRPGVLRGALPGALRPLAALGRVPLLYYMAHQPVMIGLLLAARSIAG